jgi:hypothetical protein
MDHLTVHIDTLVVELPPAEFAALLRGSTDRLHAVVEAAVLDHHAVRQHIGNASRELR